MKTTWRARRTWWAKGLLALGTVAALTVSGWGCFAALILDPRKVDDLFVLLVAVLPFPCYLLVFYSKRVGVSVLWAHYLAFWAVQMFFLRRTPAFVNPFDLLGCFYFSPLMFAQLALWVTPAAQKVRQEFALVP